MTFTDKLQALATRIPDLIAHLQTEEATKTALIMPFIAALGYDVFNPLEVVPEFTADVGTKKGEKVDYAIKRGEEVIMLFEAKRATETLDRSHTSQLYRYFSVTHARIAVLTNGVEYRFFSDLEASNKMDNKPFLVIDMFSLREDLIQQLSALTKDAFDLDGMLSAASGLKYRREIRRVLDKQFDEPNEEFVRFFFNQVCTNRNFVQSAKEQFQAHVKHVMAQTVKDRVTERLRAALAQGDARDSSPTPDGATDDTPSSSGADSAGPSSDAPRDGIVTTEEELQGLRIVRAIVCANVALERVVARDTKSYFGVLLDDNNRKPICRLHFNRSRKYISTFDADKQETRHALTCVEEIYQHAELLRATVIAYCATEQAVKTDDSDPGH